MPRLTALVVGRTAIVKAGKWGRSGPASTQMRQAVAARVKGWLRRPLHRRPPSGTKSWAWRSFGQGRSRPAVRRCVRGAAELPASCSSAHQAFWPMSSRSADAFPPGRVPLCSHAKLDRLDRLVSAEDLLVDQRQDQRLDRQECRVSGGIVKHGFFGRLQGSHSLQSATLLNRSATRPAARSRHCVGC